MARVRSVMIKILLLGCTGEVGSRLCLKLLEEGFIVFGVRGSKPCKIAHINHSCVKQDLLNSESSLDLKNFKPNIMVHTAWVTEPNIFWDSPLNYVWVRESKRLIQEFEENGGEYLVVTGTCAEYSWENQEPMSESFTENPQSSYGKSKIELLNWIRSRNLPFLWVRTFFQFGLTEPNGRLIPSLIDNILLEKNYVIQNSNFIRDFVYIKDIVGILNTLIIRKSLGIINIGSGIGIDIRSTSENIAKLMNRQDLLCYASTDNKQKSLVVSNSHKLNELLPKFVWTNFESAILETIEVRKRMLMRKI
jgi:UDP-glucuronate decarboxylase